MKKARPVFSQSLLKVTTALLILCLLYQTSLGLAIFYLKTGFTFPGLVEYYLPAEGPGRSFIGLLETYLPHIFGMGLLSFFLGHLLAFLPNLSLNLRRGLYWALMGLPVVFNLSPYLTVFVSKAFAPLILISLFLYQFSVFGVFVAIAISQKSTSQSSR